MERATHVIDFLYITTARASLGSSDTRLGKLGHLRNLRPLQRGTYTLKCRDIIVEKIPAQVLTGAGEEGKTTTARISMP